MFFSVNQCCLLFFKNWFVSVFLYSVVPFISITIFSFLSLAFCVLFIKSLPDLQLLVQLKIFFLIEMAINKALMFPFIIHFEIILVR